MKKFIAMTALSLCFSSAFATPYPKDDIYHFFKHNSVQFEAQSSGFNTDTKFSDLDWDFKLSLKTSYNNYVYDKLHVTKYGDDYGYGASLGVQYPFASFTPYSEVTYNHENKDFKLLTAKQFDYDAGVKLNYFSRLSPFLETDDFFDPDRWYIKTGLQFKVDDRLFLIGDLSFPSKLSGSQCGLGIGLDF